MKIIQRNKKNIPHSWIGGINIVKMDILHRAIYRFNVIPSKLSLDIFHRTRTNNPLKMLWNYTKDTELPRNPEEKEQSRRHNPHKFQTQSCSYQMVCYWHKNRHAGQWNRI